MSEFGGMLGNFPPVTDDPAVDRRALLALLRQRDHGSHLTAEEVFEAGQMLGFWPTPEPPRKPRVRTRQVLERDPETKRFKSPQPTGDRPTQRRVDPPSSSQGDPSTHEQRPV